MNINNITTVNVDLPSAIEYVVNYNLILSENSKIPTKQFIELFESFYNQNPKSLTYIFDFSKDVENCIDFKTVIAYVDNYKVRYGHVPNWSMYTVEPYWLGSYDFPQQTHNRVEICNGIINKHNNGHKLKLQNIWTDMKGE